MRLISKTFRFFLLLLCRTLLCFFGRKWFLFWIFSLLPAIALDVHLSPCVCVLILSSSYSFLHRITRTRTGDVCYRREQYSLSDIMHFKQFRIVCSFFRAPFYQKFHFSYFCFFSLLTYTLPFTDTANAKSVFIKFHWNVNISFYLAVQFSSW